MAVAIVALASVMGAAGALKLLTVARQPTLASQLASRSAVARIAVRALPFAEIAVAVALVAPATRSAAAVACLLLLAGFSAVFIMAWRDGDLTPCGCFGTTETRPNHAAAVMRNALLALLALEVLLAGPIDNDPVTIGLLALSIGAVGVAGVLARELRTSAARAVEAAAAPAPSLALDFPLSTTRGGRTTVREWLAEGRNQLVVFVDPICGPCRSLLPILGQWQRSAGQLAIRIVSRGPMDENAAMEREFDLAPIAVQRADGLSVRFGVSATPTALLLSPDGGILADPALGRAAIIALLNASESQPAIAPAHGAMAS